MSLAQENALGVSGSWLFSKPNKTLTRGHLYLEVEVKLLWFIQADNHGEIHFCFHFDGFAL